MKLEFDITKASIISRMGAVDVLQLKYGDKAWMRLSAPCGKGEACLHKLGWRGEYTYITNAGAETRVIEEIPGDHFDPATVERATQEYMDQNHINRIAAGLGLDAAALSDEISRRGVTIRADDKQRRIKDLSPEERTELARYLRKMKEVID